MHALVGYCLIKSGRLQYEIFTEQELNELIAPHFPFTEPLAVPIGEGHFTCLEAQLSMPTSTNRLTVQILCAIEVKVMGSRIYKAHAEGNRVKKPTHDHDLKNKTDFIR